jgi:hypothetical protein
MNQMNRGTRKQWRWAACAAWLIAAPAFAGSPERLGTAGAEELRMPVGVRSVGLGGADAGGVAGVEALYYNPAGIALAVSPTEVMFSHTQLIADMDLDYVAVTQRMGRAGTLGLSVKALSIGDIERTSETAPDGTGEIFSPTFAVLGLSFGRELTDRVTFGGTVSYVSEHILQENARALAFDFGFQYDTDFRGLRFGLAMKNVGPSAQFTGTDFERLQQIGGDDPQAAKRALSSGSADFELPTWFQFGLSYPALRGPQGVLTVHGLYTSNSFMVDEGRIGAEYMYRKDYALRAGYKLTTDGSDLFGFTYGAGIRVAVGSSHLWLDYAGESVSEFFNDVQHLGLTFQF